jgi:Suppressor of fused protein (SUFU)
MMLTLEQYKQAMKQDEEWAPGWQSIDEAMEKLYGAQEPEHFGSLLTSRAILGGSEYLDGYSIYTSKHGYKHLITYGMSELYAGEESYGKEYSKWGYEMTIKLAEENTEDCKWAMSMLGNLARYTFTSERWFEPNQFVMGNGDPIKLESDSKITSLIIVKDDELPTLHTVHGEVQFLQLVGVTWKEIQVIREDLSKLNELVNMMKQDNPMLVTDLNRTREYF